MKRKIYLVAALALIASLGVDVTISEKGITVDGRKVKAQNTNLVEADYIVTNDVCFEYNWSDPDNPGPFEMGYRIDCIQGGSQQCREVPCGLPM